MISVVRTRSTEPSHLHGVRKSSPEGRMSWSNVARKKRESCDLAERKRAAKRRLMKSRRKGERQRESKREKNKEE